MASEPAHFLNLDLEVEASALPDHVAGYLKDKCDLLYDGPCEGGTRLTFEPGLLNAATLNQCVERFLQLLEAMPDSAAEQWYGCKIRRFDFGFESGTGRLPFVGDLGPETLTRMAKLKLDLRVTIYGMA